MWLGQCLVERKALHRWEDFSFQCVIETVFRGKRKPHIWSFRLKHSVDVELLTSPKSRVHPLGIIQGSRPPTSRLYLTLR